MYQYTVSVSKLYCVLQKKYLNAQFNSIVAREKKNCDSMG